jgi:hypothetical protein
MRGPGCRGFAAHPGYIAINRMDVVAPMERAPSHLLRKITDVGAYLTSETRLQLKSGITLLRLYDDGYADLVGYRGVEVYVDLRCRNAYN